MRKNVSKVFALALAASMVLSGCGGGDQGTASTTAAAGETTAAGESSAAGETQAEAPVESAIEDLIYFESPNREQEGFFILNTEKAQDLNVLCNLYSPLLEVNEKGQLQPAVATEWGTEDGGLTWTFKLRDDVKWVDINGNEMAPCNAQDWITAMEWVLNFHKNGGNNTSMPCALIKGAQEYYDYTKELSAEEAKALTADGKFKELVGVEAPDDYTLVYTCTQNAPYFDTVATSACLYPTSQALIDTLGVDNMISMTNETMWYNGPYFETSFIMNNEKVLTPNPTYWDKEAQLFNSVTIRMIDATMQYQLFETGEVDAVDLAEAELRSIYDDPNHKYHNNLVEKRPKKFSYQMHLNYAKNKEDGTPDTNWNTAVANEAFRQSMYYGLDFTKYWARTNFINPMNCGV